MVGRQHRCTGGSLTSAALGLALLFAACGPSPVVTPVVESVESVAAASSWNPRSLAPGAAPGLMAFAHLNTPDTNLPIVVTGDGAPLPTGTLLQAYGGTGLRFEVRAEPQKQYRYGCDGGSTLMQEFATTTASLDIPAGVAWLVKQPVPAWMSIEAVPIETSSTKVARDMAAGPLHISQQMKDSGNGEMVIEVDDRLVGRVPFEFAIMSGFEDQVSLDLRDEKMVGIPMPIAVWLLAPGGPALMAVRTNGYEGMSIATYLVGATSVDLVESLSTYLYNCAA